MNNGIALWLSNWSLVLFMVPLILFVIYYIPMLRKRPSTMGWAVLGSKLALIAIAGTVIMRNFFPDLPGLALVRLLIFLSLVGYFFYDFAQLMRARHETRVSKKVKTGASDIVQPDHKDDTPDHY